MDIPLNPASYNVIRSYYNTGDFYKGRLIIGTLILLFRI